MAGQFLEFARYAEHEGSVNFPAFLQHIALGVADAEAEPRPAPAARLGITFADDDGNIVAWFRITPDGRLDAGGDTSKWTAAAQSLISDLRRIADTPT